MIRFVNKEKPTCAAPQASQGPHHVQHSWEGAEPSPPKNPTPQTLPPLNTALTLLLLHLGHWTLSSSKTPKNKSPLQPPSFQYCLNSAFLCSPGHCSCGDAQPLSGASSCQVTAELGCPGRDFPIKPKQREKLWKDLAS